MPLIGAIYREIFFRPILNLLVYLYDVIPVKDLGLAVICVVAVIRLMLAPFFKKATAAQMQMTKLQPEISALQKKYKNDKEAQTKAMLQLYRDHKINPFSSILMLFAQLPIMIALYQVFLKGLQPDGLGRMLYPFVEDPGEMNKVFLGAVDLTVPFIPLAIAAAAAQFFQMKLATPSLPATEHKEHSVQTMMARQMLYIGPAFTLAILWKFPSVIALYWFLTTIFALWQQYGLLRKDKGS